MAKLVPPGASRPDIGKAIDDVRALRRRIKPLADVTIRELIQEGRHF